MRDWLKILGFTLCGIVPASLVSYLFWWPIRGWCFAQIPPEAQWAGLAKILIVCLVGYFGGIAIPVVILFIGFAVGKEMFLK